MELRVDLLNKTESFYLGEDIDSWKQLKECILFYCEEVEGCQVSFLDVDGERVKIKDDYDLEYYVARVKECKADAQNNPKKKEIVNKLRTLTFKPNQLCIVEQKASVTEKLVFQQLHELLNQKKGNQDKNSLEDEVLCYKNASVQIE